MLHFEDDKDFPQTAPTALTEKLGDAQFLAGCVPGVEATPRAERDVAVCVLRPKLGFIRGTLEVTLRVVEVVPGASVRYQVHGKGIGSSNDVDASLALTPVGPGTRVHWAADLKNLGGLLKAMPQGLLKASAQRVIDEIWAQIEAKV